MNKKNCLQLQAMIAFAVTVPCMVSAQTVLNGPPAGVQNPAAIKEQQDGVYPPLPRGESQTVRAQGGMIQEAWSNEDAATAGYYDTLDCFGCVHRMRLRDGMVSAIILPAGSEILHSDFGQPGSFSGAVRAPNIFIVQPNGFGIDTSLLLHLKSGKMHSFYLRAESITSETVPDVVYRINARGLEERRIEVEAPVGPYDAGYEAPIISETDSDEASAAPLPTTVDLVAMDKPIKKDLPDRGALPDFARVKVDPEKIHGFRDYRIFGSADSDQITPSVIYRDDKFTYLQFSQEIWDKGMLPTAFVTQEGIDHVVNTRVSGTTFIVEKLTKLITLKYGQSYLCIEYQGS